MPLKRLQAILGYITLEMTLHYILEDEAQINGSHSPFDQLVDVKLKLYLRAQAPENY